MGRHSRRGPAPRSAPKNSSSATPGYTDGTPARGTSPHPDGTPAHGGPRYPDGTPAQGVPQVRGGHPEQREAGGGWGELRGRQGRPGQPVIPRQRPVPAQGPRQDYLDAFGGYDDEDDDVFSRAGRAGAATRTRAPYTASPAMALTDPYAPAAGRGTALPAGDPEDDAAPPTGTPVDARGTKGRAFVGIAAAAVTTVLAVVVAGQVTDTRDEDAARSRSAAGGTLDTAAPSPAVPSPAAAVALTYEQKMDTRYRLGATLKGSGRFDAIPGVDKAPGRGQKYTYRVDVEQGLGLDGELFAQAVQKTLNDDRSWAHGGARTFERIHSGKPDFVITLASPGTTAVWCAKSGLDTTEDNVSCDSAATERVMINAYRWAQGSKTYGDDIHGYRQMLINHEVGHRLGNHHVTCDKDGELAPVMQQQTKFLDHDGIHCLPNPWPYPAT